VISISNIFFLLLLNMHLKLLIYDEDLDEERFIPLNLDIEAIQGFYQSVDDDNIINLVSYGQIFSVKKTHPLMTKLNYELN